MARDRYQAGVVVVVGEKRSRCGVFGGVCIICLFGFGAPLCGWNGSSGVFHGRSSGSFFSLIYYDGK
jgi:hypothetical protein